MTGRRAAALVAALLAVACGTPDRGPGYVTGFDAAEEAETAGRFAEAARLYDDAAKHAKIPRDRQHAEYLAARLLARSGERADAAARLRAIADASPPWEDSPEAAYALADLTIASGDDAGWAQLVEVAKRFPSSALGRRALLRAAKHDDDTVGPRAALAKLESLAPALDHGDLAEPLAYSIALRLDALGEKEKARDAFLALATRFPYPTGAYWDDALFRASELDEALGRVPAAIADLERMLAERESSFLVGSYERPRYEPAMIRSCVLERDRLADRTKARACFDRVYRELTTSELRDDALWEEARLAREDGDTKSSCDVLQRLATEFPSSRYVPCATATCPELSVQDAGAPRTCHPYISEERLGAGPTNR